MRLKCRYFPNVFAWTGVCVGGSFADFDCQLITRGCASFAHQHYKQFPKGTNFLISSCYCFQLMRQCIIYDAVLAPQCGTSVLQTLFADVTSVVCSFSDEYRINIKLLLLLLRLIKTYILKYLLVDTISAPSSLSIFRLEYFVCRC